MKHLLVSVLVVLGGCNGSKPEAKTAPASEAKAGAAEAKAPAKAPVEAEAKPSAKVQDEQAPAAKAAVPAEPAAAAQGPALELFEGEGGLSGYRTAAGEVVIPAKYSMASPFVDAVAAVLSDKGWVFIDAAGKVFATPFLFDNGPDEFVDGRARVVEGDEYGFLASTGELVVPPKWSFVTAFSGGYGAVCEGCKREDSGEHFVMSGGKWGYVDAAGKLVIPPRFDEAGPFVDGRATVKEGGRELVIGPDGVEQK